MGGLAFSLLIGALGVAAQRLSPANATITLRPEETHQTIEGWEATARLWEYDKANDRFDGSWMAQRDPILAELINQGGIDRLRLEIRSGAENPVDYWTPFQRGQIGYLASKRRYYEKINDNDDPGVLNPAGVQFAELDFRVENIILPAQRIAAARGRRLKVVLCYVDFKWTEAKGTLSQARHPQEYAELIAATYAHLKAKYGLVPDALEVVLEPDNTDDWGGREIGAAMVATAARLQAAGVQAPMIAPSTAAGSVAAGYFDDMAKVPGAVSHLATLSYHRYDGASADKALPGIVKRARSVRAKTAMLEFVYGDFDDLMRDLTQGDVSAWQLYGVAWNQAARGDERPGYMVAVRNLEGTPIISLSNQGRDLAQVFNFVEAGAVRLGVVSDDESKTPVAFRNPAGDIVLVIKAQRRGEIRLVGLPAGRYGLRVSGEDRAAVIVADEGGSVSLEAGEVATLYRARAGAGG